MDEETMNELLAMWTPCGGHEADELREIIYRAYSLGMQDGFNRAYS